MWATLNLFSGFILLWSPSIGALAYDTDLSSALCLIPSATYIRGLLNIDLCQMPEKQKPPSSLCIQQLSPSSRLHSGPSLPPHRWWKLLQHPDTHGPVEELSLCRIYGQKQRGMNIKCQCLGKSHMYCELIRVYTVFSVVKCSYNTLLCFSTSRNIIFKNHKQLYTQQIGPISVWFQEVKVYRCILYSAFTV